MKSKKKNSGKIQPGVGEVPALVLAIPYTDPTAGKLLQALIDLMVKDSTTPINDIAALVEHQEDIQEWQLANGIIVSEEVIRGGSTSSGREEHEEGGH